MNSNSWYNDFFFVSDATQSVVLPQYSVCLSVTFRYWYLAHIGWNSSKIISRPNSLRLCAGWPQVPNMGDLVQREPPNYGRIEVGPGAHKAVISPKWCKIGPRLLLRTNRKSHRRFRLAPQSMTSDDLERPKRHSCWNKQKNSGA